jgi:hypothetical protein
MFPSRRPAIKRHLAARQNCGPIQQARARQNCGPIQQARARQNCGPIQQGSGRRWSPPPAADATLGLARDGPGATCTGLVDLSRAECPIWGHKIRYKSPIWPASASCGAAPALVQEGGPACCGAAPAWCGAGRPAAERERAGLLRSRSGPASCRAGRAGLLSSGGGPAWCGAGRAGLVRSGGGLVRGGADLVRLRRLALRRPRRLRALRPGRS